MNISDEAVEAAAKAWHEATYKQLWENAATIDQDVAREEIQYILEAAVPHLMAQAWEEGGEAAIERWHTYGAEEKAKFSNPYTPEKK